MRSLVLLLLMVNLSCSKEESCSNSDFAGYISESSGLYSLSNIPCTSGAAIRVVRSSDNEEKDFQASELSDGTLASWVGAGNDGYVYKWYDRSGNGNHATQPDSSKRPTIVESGTVNTLNGKPAIKFVDADAGGQGQYLIIETWFNRTDRYTAIASVFGYNSNGYFPHLIASGDSDNDGPVIITMQGLATLRGGIGREGPTTSLLQSTTVVSLNVSHVRVDTFDRLGKYRLYYDGAFDTEVNDNDGDIRIPDTNEFWIGSSAPDVIRNDMYIQEMYLFRNDRSGDADDIMRDLNEIYSIY